MFLLNSVQYITFHTPNMKDMLNYYEQVLGLTKIAGSTDDKILLSVHDDLPTVILRQAEQASVGEVGFTVKGEEQWNEIVSRLSNHSIPSQEEDSDLFGRTLSFSDYDGHPIRIFMRQPLAVKKRSSRFGPLLSRLHHVTYASPNPKRFAEFYENILNFKISDKVEGDQFIWLRTDQEHHTVAAAAHKTAGLDHFAFELPDWESFKAFCDYLGNQNVEVIWGPGRHGPGNNLFFFTVDPDGNRVEYSSEMELFHDDIVTYQPRVWKNAAKTVNLWGVGAPWPRELP